MIRGDARRREFAACSPRKLAAGPREVAPGAVGSLWRPALDKVWEYIRRQPGLRTDGHTTFFLPPPVTKVGRADSVDSVSRLTRTFETAGEVYAI